MKNKLITLFLFLLNHCFAGTVTIYRGGVSITPVYPNIKLAVENSLSGDSLVLSADTFNECNIVIDKSLKITGVSSLTDIFPSSSTTGYFDSSVLKIINNDPLHSVVTFEIKDINISNGFAQNGPDAGGGAIFADLGTRVFVKGKCYFQGNVAPDSATYGVHSPYGAAIFSKGFVEISGTSNITANHGLYGGAIYSTDTLIVKDKVLIGTRKLGVQKGGAIFTKGVLICRDSSFVGGIALQSGGAIYALDATVLLQNATKIDSSYAYESGGAIYLNNCHFTMQDSVLIEGNSVFSEKGAAIYAVGNNMIEIKGGQIIHNKCMDPLGGCMDTYSIYNDSLSGSSSIWYINNARIFNPSYPCNEHNSEFINLQERSSVLSDSTWWGESDTSNLIRNVPSATVAIRSYIQCDWSVNAGLPIDTNKSFPIEAYFTLHSGAALPPKMFWMLNGVYLADSGYFTPPVAPMAATNIISSTYNVPFLSAAVPITAYIDADTLHLKPYVIGLGLKTMGKNKSLLIYPNPATNMIYVAGFGLHQKRVQYQLFDLMGKQIVNTEASIQQQVLPISLSLLPGLYLLKIMENGQLIGQEKILIQ